MFVFMRIKMCKFMLFNSLRMFVLFLGVLSLSGCGAYGVVSQAKKERFNNESHSWICGKFYELEFFTGKRDYVSKSDINAAIDAVATKGINCKDYQESLYSLDKIEKEKYYAHQANQSASKVDGALIGSAICMAFAKNSKECVRGAMESAEDEDEKFARLQRLQKQNELRIRQLEIESQNQKLLLEQQEQKRNSLQNCLRNGKFC